MVTQESLKYICNNDHLVIFWHSSVFGGIIFSIAGSSTIAIPILATGVTLVKNDNNNATCHNSTLTFTGAVADLEQLNGAVLTCFDGSSQTDNVTIVIRIPGENNF